MQPEEEIIKPEPFDAEKFLAHLQKLNRENPPQPFTGMALLGNDDERVREAAQREVYWVSQIRHLQSFDDYSQTDMDHAREELGHALFSQGHIDEALSLAQNPERRAHYMAIQDAILKDDKEFCDCPEIEIVDAVKVNGQPGINQLWHTVGFYPSQKHGGQMTPIQHCAKCGFTNIANL